MERGLTDWRDILIVGLYFAFVLAVGIWSSCRKGRETVKGYFLAGRNMHWISIGCSLFASNIGSEHFIGLAGSGAKSGIAVVAFEWGAVLLLLLLGWLFLPVYLISGVYTMPEYLERRYGGSRLRLYLSIVSQILYIVSTISVDIYAGTVFIQQALGWNTYISISVLLVVTAIYTIIGGLSAVIFTDALQTIVMLVGSLILAIIAYIKVGGLFALQSKYPGAIPSSYYGQDSTNSTCALPRDDAFHIFRDPVHSDLPWPGVLVRSTLASLWYWCTSQVIVQRTLAAKSLAHARGATITAGYLKILPLFLIIFPGMISRVLYTDEVACVDGAVCKAVCDNEAGCSNIAYPKLVLELAPVGLRGLMLAVMMSAVMSSLTSIFNSAATLFTIDIWRKVRADPSQRELLLAGRLFVLVLVGISVAWIPLIKAAQGAQLFMYIQAVNGYLAPPVCAVFLLGVILPRTNEQGAFWGLLIGQLTGLTRLALDYAFPAPGCGQEDTRPAFLANVHFTYFAAIVLAESTLIILVVSFCTEKPDKNKIKGLTIWSVHEIQTKLRRMNDRTSANGLDSLALEEAALHPDTNCDMLEEPAKADSVADSGSKHAQDALDKADSVIDSGTKRTEDARLRRQCAALTIPDTLNVVLSLNAILLLCVFVVLYGIFA